MLPFLTGCAISSKNHSILSPSLSAEQSLRIEDRSAPCDTILTCKAMSGSAILENMIREAHSLCRKGQYASADSLARELLTLLDSGEWHTPGDSTSSVEPYIGRVVDMYCNEMPGTFPVPEVITTEVFHRQLLGALDSVRLTRDDSLLANGFFNKNAIASDVPLVWNSRVERALFYYLTRNQTTVERWKERSGTYLGFMKKMFADSGLPCDLAYLPLIESGFNPKAYSRAHASGIWQFIASTGKRYDLRSSYWFDERRDPVRSTVAAIRYLKKLHADFGDWYLALAAYNCGEGGLSRAIAKQGTYDYWNLKLAPETMNYVPYYLASLVIAKSPDFVKAAQQHADTVPFDMVRVNDCIDLRDIAGGIGVSYDTLKKINPHILHWCTPPDMTDICLYLPLGSASAFEDFYEQLPPEKKVKWYRYRVRSGDNLISIARQFRIPVEGIRSVNRLHGTRIIAGKYLFIPIPADSPGYNKESVAQRAQVKRATFAASVPDNAKLTLYEVKPGDTVWRIAELFEVSSDQLCTWNNLHDARIKAGQILNIYIVDGALRIDEEGGGAQSSNAQRQGCSVSPVVEQHSAQTLRYVVSGGDNLYRIAKNFSVTVDCLCKLNGLHQGAVIREGDTLSVPAVAPRAGAPVETAMRDVVYYQIKTGDNLWRIANTFGVPLERLYEFNDLGSTSVLVPGDTILVLRGGELLN